MSGVQPAVNHFGQVLLSKGRLYDRIVVKRRKRKASHMV